MRRFEREVIDPKLIEEMLYQFDTVHLGLNDDNGYPYVVPVNFGFEIKDNKLFVYIHSTKSGHKIDLMKKDPKVCLSFSMFNDFPYHEYKKHRHDYRSVIAKGIIKIIDSQEDYNIFKHGYDLLYTCNHREIVPLESRKVTPPIYICVVECDMKDVTAKSEFPIRTKEDVPFIDVYHVEEDHDPFDLSDIINKRKKGN